MTSVVFVCYNHIIKFENKKPPTDFKVGYLNNGFKNVLEKRARMDLRTERTKRSIINAFIDLRVKKPLEKITVKELAELAYINKATFYSHYHDIYDLSEQLEEEAIANILKNIPHPESIISNPKLCFLELNQALTSQNSLTKILFADSRAAILSARIEQAIKEYVFESYPEYKEDVKWNIVLSFIIQGGFHAAQKYYNSGNTDDKKYMAAQIISEMNECITKNFLYSDFSKE